MLRKELGGAHENSDRLCQNVKALHDISNANVFGMIKLWKEHDFARRRLKG